MIRTWLVAVPLVACLAALACGSSDDDPATTPAATSTSPAATQSTTTETSTSTPTEQATTTATPTATMEPTPTPLPTTSAPSTQPAGFPFDPATRLGVVVGEVPNRTIDWENGPAALEYSRDGQPSNDPAWANRAGWNCRVHVEYEGIAAVDWYFPTGTPLIATMEGTATLYVITTENAFDVYGADREPFIGNPDRSRAALSPFPGPGGGKGVFVELTNGEFALEYAHLDLAQTLPLVPEGSFAEGYSAGTDYASLFAPMRDFRQSTRIASWTVQRGDVIGYSGDAGYSEAPHLHYTIRRHGGPLLCPTNEPGFSDGGWLFR